MLSFGTAGCNLACKFCQNWDISKSRRDRHAWLTAPRPETIAAVARRSRWDAAVSPIPTTTRSSSWNMPLTRRIACRGGRDIKSVAVTAGYICARTTRAEFFQYMDAANVDLKAFSEGFYKKICGGRLGDVLDTLVYLKNETDVWFELTTLLIPGENDGDDELERMTRWVVENLGDSVPMHFSAFHPDWRMLDHPPTPAATLTRAREIAVSNGVRYAYTGNVHDASGGSTYCHRCGQVLVGRDWYELGTWNLDGGGACKSCGCALPGVFEARPGDWGAKRRPVRI